MKKTNTSNLNKKRPHEFTESLPLSNGTLKTLPIDKYRDEIISKIKKNRVIVISGKTGCGKTTQVPWMLLEDVIQNNNLRNTKILVTQPRRIAAITIAERIQLEMMTKLRKYNLPSDINPRNLVGYRVRLNSTDTQNSKIVLMTTGILLEKIIHSKSDLSEYSHIIIDEVHERDINIDFALVLLKYILKKNKAIKLILMSATISPELFANYYREISIEQVGTHMITIPSNKLQQFGEESSKQEESNTINIDWSQVPVRVSQNKITLLPDAIEIIEIKEQIHQVTIFYHQQIEQTIKDSYKHELAKEHYQFDFKKVGFVYNTPLLNFDLLDTCQHLVNCIHHKIFNQNDNFGSILIFLPGIGEIYQLKDQMESGDILHRIIDELLIIAIHSNSTDVEQREAFAKIYNKRKIILATNIAESSITIPDVDYVIDFCLVKESTINPYSHREMLRLAWASRANCDQRAGRTGRVKQGYVFRLVEKNFYYSNEYLQYPTAEILRIPLEKLILKIKEFEKNPLEILAEMIEIPYQEDIISAIITLRFYGAITDPIEKDITGNLTKLGHVYSALPIEIEYSRLIIMCHAFGIIELGITASAILSKDRSIFNSTNRLSLLRAKQKFACNSDCDILANCIAFTVWMNMFHYPSSKKNQKRFYQRRSDEKPWCAKNSLNHRLMLEIADQITDIKKRLCQLFIYDYSEEEDDKNKNIAIQRDINKPIDELEREAFEKIIFCTPEKINIFKYAECASFLAKIIRLDYSSYEAIEKVLSKINNKRKKKIEYQNALVFDNLRSVVEFPVINAFNFFNKFGEVKELIRDDNIFVVVYSDETSAKAIGEILFLGSKALKYNRNLSFDGYERVTLTEPKYLYSIEQTDISTRSRVFIDRNSLNHVMIEKVKKNLQYSFYVCEDFFQSYKDVFLTSYASKLPMLPNIDILMFIIFCPDGTFQINKEKTRYESFDGISMAGQKNTYDFNYLLSSKDICSINEIRLTLNQIVRDIEDIDKVRMLGSKVITQLESFVNKNWIKIIKYQKWENLMNMYYPQRSKDEHFQKIPKMFAMNSEIISKFKSEDFLRGYKLPEDINEDFRLYTNEGIQELIKDKILFNRMKAHYKEEMNWKRYVVEQPNPFIKCKNCKQIICSFSDSLLTPNQNYTLFQINQFFTLPTIEVDNPSIYKDPLVIQCRENIKHFNPSSYLICERCHLIIGFVHNSKSVLTIGSKVYVSVNAGYKEIEYNWEQNIFKTFLKEELVEAEKKRQEFIKHLECKLCSFIANSPDDFLCHVKSKVHMDEMKLLEEEEM